jgi:hypothetical protein
MVANSIGRRRRTVRSRQKYARAESVVRLVLGALLDAGAFEPYWFSIPCSQSDLGAHDLLHGDCVPVAVLERVHDALEKNL